MSQYVEEWLQHGKCRGAKINIWFPEMGQPAAPAKAICRECAVSVECLNYALRENIRHGVWGGASERERRRLRRQQHG